MISKTRIYQFAWLCAFTAATMSSQPLMAAELSLQQGDHICLVGNALGERMQHRNHFEARLHAAFPAHDLVVRNLCFPGDEVDQRLRSFNFGSPDDHLRHSRATVILFFFGYNESFAGTDGLQTFSEQLRNLLRETRTKSYDGQQAPRVALISPIAFEPTGDPNLPDGASHNERLQSYVWAMQQVGRDLDVPFVDLFTPTLQLFADTPDRLTINGFHLNDRGYQELAPLLMAGLFGEQTERASIDHERLREEIADKNFHWWHRYRAVNGYSIYGKRNQAGYDGRYRNVDVMERERAILDQMCAHRDRRIWQLARGNSVSEVVDDYDMLPFFEPKSNYIVDKKGSPPAYLTAEQQRAQFKLAPGYEIDLIASEEDIPELVNPVAMNFDADGRLWVATMPSYPQWKPKTKLNDRIIILTNQDQDGRFRDCRVFADGLHQPTGFELGLGGAYVAQQPDILFLKDTDGDDQADVRVRELIGFDTADSHHGLAAFEWGPGGGLYFQEGTFKQSQVEAHHGVERLSDAGVWRYDPRSKDLRVFVSVAFANPWGHVFDRWGQNFVADASDGLNYWAAPMSGYLPHPNKHPGGWIANKGWDKLPLVIPRRMRPSSGCELVSTRQFPDAAQGNYLLNNVIGLQGVMQHTLTDDGAGFAGKEIEPLIRCEDANFRPVDLQFGPDGALYIVDWHNALIGHLQHNLRDPHRDRKHGRIWRIRYAAKPLLPPIQLSHRDDGELLDLLRTPEDRTRYRVRRELASRPTTRVMAHLAEWVQASRSAKAPTLEADLLEALWLQQTHHAIDPSLLSELLGAQRHEVRAAAVRVLSFSLDKVNAPHQWLQERIHDPHPRVRLEAVRACSFLPPTDESVELAVGVLSHDMDAWLEYTLDETMRALGR